MTDLRSCSDSAEKSLRCILLTTGLQYPAGIYVSAATGEIWVADAGNRNAIRFTSFDQLVAQNGQPNATIQTPVGLRAVVEDGWGNLFLADTANRITIYYPGLGVVNNASYLYTSQLRRACSRRYSPRAMPDSSALRPVRRPPSLCPPR